MDSESVSTIHDAFLFDVHRQFERLARWVAAPFVADVWEDGREAVSIGSQTEPRNGVQKGPQGSILLFGSGVPSFR